MSAYSELTARERTLYQIAIMGKAVNGVMIVPKRLFDEVTAIIEKVEGKRGKRELS